MIIIIFVLNKEAAAKHIQELKQLKAEKKVLEKELKKTQVSVLKEGLLQLKRHFSLTALVVHTCTISTASYRVSAVPRKPFHRNSSGICFWDAK